jgi:ADP-ribose pyrophosphatase YjhB (NUDIX family)
MRAIFRIDISCHYMPTHPHDPDDAARFRFCPVCGGAMGAKTLKTGDPPRLVCSACDFVYYVDPKVAVGTIIGRPDGSVALVRRTIDPGYGKWVFPGGYVDRGEVVQEAAIREAREECGLEVRLDRLLNIYSYRRRTAIIVVYRATAIGGVLAAGDESDEARWFGPEEIPWEDLAFPSTADALREYLEGRAATSSQPMDKLGAG